MNQRQAILDAIREMDPDAAETAMREHLVRVKREKDDWKEKSPSFIKLSIGAEI